MLVVLEKELSFLLSSPIEDKDESRDLVFYKEGDVWHKVPRECGTFLLETMVACGDDAFILTRDGKLLKANSSRITDLQAPGACEALTKTVGGKVLASFTHLGIYAYEGRWVLQYSCPYLPNEQGHRAHLAEENGIIAFATNSAPRWRDSDKKTVEYTGTSRLWVSQGPSLLEIPLGMSE